METFTEELVLSEESLREEADTQLKKEESVFKFHPTHEGNKCSICQDTELYKDVLILPCAHKFHELCINEWLKKKSVCPICRHRIDRFDEGIGEGYELESSVDEAVAVDSPSGGAIGRLETSDLDGVDEGLLIGHFNGESNLLNEGFIVHELSNVFLNNDESHIYLESCDSNSESGNGESDNNISYFEAESSESDDEQETNEACSEPEIFNSSDESETNEIYDGAEIIIFSDEMESSESDNGLGGSDLEHQHTAESDSESEIRVSDSEITESETEISESDSEISESDSEITESESEITESDAETETYESNNDSSSE